MHNGQLAVTISICVKNNKKTPLIADGITRNQYDSLQNLEACSSCYLFGYFDLPVKLYIYGEKFETWLKMYPSENKPLFKVYVQGNGFIFFSSMPLRKCSLKEYEWLCSKTEYQDEMHSQIPKGRAGLGIFHSVFPDHESDGVFDSGNNQTLSHQDSSPQAGTAGT